MRANYRISFRPCAFTLDSDFYIYRLNEKQPFNVIP
jgi:hypothetical protein